MPTVLVTGASRGIGKTIATHLAANGWDVTAGVRTDADGARLQAESPRIAPVRLDVTNDKDIAALDQSLPEQLDAVVNNAGVVVAGPMEFVPPDELRRQLEINVVGQIAVTQAVLARLRSSRGRIVFISSVNGKIAFPLLGPYCASKFALEALADALRIELKPWGIAVAVVKALTARHPRARYVVGFGPKLQVALITALPTGIRDRMLRAVSRQPG